MDGIATSRFPLRRGFAGQVAGLAMTVAVGCASTGGLDARVAQLEQELKAARAAPAATRPFTAEEAVALGNAKAAAVAPLVAFVDERPALCRGALCWTIENGHGNPVLLTIDGQPVQVVGPAGPLLPPGSRAYVRLTTPGYRVLSYELYDSIALGGTTYEMPLPTVIAQCRAEGYIGRSVDAYWSGHMTRLDHSFCY